MKTAPIILLIAFSASSYAQNLDAATATFYRRAGELLKAKQVAEYCAHLRANVTSDFRYVEHTGRALRVPEVSSLYEKDYRRFSKILTVDENVHRIKDKGDHAMVIVWHRTTGFELAKDKKQHSLAIQGASQDVWRKVGGGWKLASTTWISHLYLVDGQDPSRPKR